MTLTKKLLLAVAVTGVAATGMAEHLKSLNAEYIDKTTPAGTDFYKHVNKGWMEANPLTPEYSRYGQFNILNDSSNNRIKRIVTGLAATNPKKGTVAYKVSNFYQLALDSVRRNAEGATPIKADL